MPVRGRVVTARKGGIDRTSTLARNNQRANVHTKNSGRKSKQAPRNMSSLRFGAGMPRKQTVPKGWHGIGIVNGFNSPIIADIRDVRGMGGSVKEQSRGMHVDEDFDQFIVPMNRPQNNDTRRTCSESEEVILPYRRNHSLTRTRPTLEEKVLVWVLPLLLTLSLVFTLICIFTPRWYIVHPHDTNAIGYFGLLEHCGEEYHEFYREILCHKREGKWKFQSSTWPYPPIKNREYDIILLLLIASVLFTVVGILLSFISCCHKQRYYAWLIMMVTVVSVLFDIAGTSHFEKSVAKANDTANYEHGYSFGLAWAGVVLLLLIILGAIRLIKLQSKRVEKDSLPMVYVGTNNDNDSHDTTVHFYETAEQK